MMLDERKMTTSVGAFFAANGRWPSAAASQGYERSLGVWLNQQRLDDTVAVMDSFRRDYLDQNLPGWKACAEDIWHERARESSDFILSYCRQPVMGAETKGEQLIAIWLTSQRALLRSGCLGFGRLTWLNAHCPNWQGDAGQPMFGKRRPS